MLSVARAERQAGRQFTRKNPWTDSQVLVSYRRDQEVLQEQAAELRHPGGYHPTGEVLAQLERKEGQTSTHSQGTRRARCRAKRLTCQRRRPDDRSRKGCCGHLEKPGPPPPNPNPARQQLVRSRRP